MTKAKMKGKIFKSSEIISILSKQKTQFREVIKVQPPTYIKNVNFAGQGTWEWGNSGVYVEESYQKGQMIFVKESFNIFAGQVAYKQNLANAERYIWKPASQMKQEHSRITLEITNIKVERLADISKEDAIKEGATSRPNCHGYANRYEGWCMNWNKVGEASKWASNRKTLSESDVCMGSAQYAFGNFWNATHKKPEEKFEANPFVWCISFEVIK